MRGAPSVFGCLCERTSGLGEKENQPQREGPQTPVDTSNPATTWTVKSGHHGVAFEAVKVYREAWSRCKSARVLVRQLLGPHLRT